ncbi:MAG: Gldg family protein [Alphaproteobacteria bacterium]|nr:Gldg family protein [Alphaproteobacteria bacterium]
MNALARLARNRRLSAVLAIVLGAIVFLGLNTAANSWLRTARLDLTANGIYTLSDGTKNILRSLKEPITLRFYYSQATAADYPTVRAYAERVRDLLNEYKGYANGNLIVEEIDPEPYTEEEDRAVAYGLQAAPTKSGEQVYLGLAGTNLADGQETVPFFQMEREQFLEYDLSSIVYRLSQAKKPKLGLVTGLPLDTGPGGLLASMQGQSQPYVSYAQLMQIFDVETLGEDFDRVPADIETLIVAQPKALSEATLYALDQFVMRGGRIIAFVDPKSEIAELAAAQNGEQGPPQNVRGDLWLLKYWGVDYKQDEVVLDRARGAQVQYGNNPSRPSVLYPVWIGLKKSDDASQDDFDPNDIVTSSLSTVNLASAGHFTKAADATTTFTPLMRSSDDAMIMSAEMLGIQTDPDTLMRQFLPSGERYTIAARVSGPLKSAFKDGAPKAAPPAEGQPAPAPLPAHLGETASANIIVVADSDIFDDKFWVQPQSQGGQMMAMPIADNLAFIASAAENMQGSNDLISLRARATNARPFTVVEDLRKDAEARFLLEEQQLNAKIAETQQKLAQLQNAAPQGGGDQLALSPEQNQELEKFRLELADTRARLREVQRNLRSGIDRLGNVLAAINIALVPALLVIAAIVLAVVRRRRIAAAQAS